MICDLMKFNPEIFIKFDNSTNIDGNYVGIYNNDVVRIIEERKDEYKSIFSFVSEIPHLIQSEIISEDQNKLVIKHPKLEYITYFTEWTSQQKVDAANCIIELQEFLAKKSYSLIDPHSFNITFQNGMPIYFDLGSIRKKSIKPSVWFIKNFCGGNEKDYWDSVLKISPISKLWITIRLLFSSTPYEYLKKKVSKYSTTVTSEIIKSNFNLLMQKYFKKILKRFSKNFTQWTNYNQTIGNSSVSKDPRTDNFIKMIKKYNPDTLTDIGANKGAFTKLALMNGVQKAIAIDLDNNSLEELRGEIVKNKLPIYTALLNLMEYDEKPGCYKSYYSAHDRLNANFVICFAVVHHLCYFGSYSFEEFSNKLAKFANKILLVEFVPFNDIHLKGEVYKGKDRLWYTIENFIASMKINFPGEHEIFESVPKPRILVKFEK